MLREDNSGFVIFPTRTSTRFKRLETGKTLVYFVVFDIEDINRGKYCLSNLNLELPGEFVADDISKNNIYFDKDGLSIQLTTSICVGWSNYSYEDNDGSDWVATFDKLSNEGKKLYYSLRKLHNNKEIRILTFKNY